MIVARVPTNDTEVGFSYLIARWLSPRCLTRLGLCCVDWYDMVSDNYFQTLLASLFERITRPDWCAAGLCSHGECAPPGRSRRALRRRRGVGRLAARA